VVTLRISRVAVTVIGCLLVSLIARGDDPRKNNDLKQGTPKFVTDFGAIRKEIDEKLAPIYEKMQQEYEAAKSEADREKVQENIRTEIDTIVTPAVRSALEVIKPYASDPAAVEPLVWVVRFRSQTNTGYTAAELLMKHHLVRIETIELAKSMKQSGSRWVEPMLRGQLAAADLPEGQKWRVMLSLAMCLQIEGRMAAHLADADEAVRKRFEQNGKDHLVKMTKLDAGEREEEAIRLFTELSGKYAKQEITRGLTVGDVANSSVFEIKNLGIGKIAPDIEGEDLDGVKFKLSDSRGKVVLLSFWGSWCGPCMELVPHENELVAQYKHKPFELIGVNSDADIEVLKPVLKEHKIAWRSFWCGTKGSEGPIARAWNVNKWPEVYLIDHNGVIRAKNSLGQALDAKIEKLVVEAEEKANTKQ
jgi:thiol-disulfide isomerase/thioredoxin